MIDEWLQAQACYRLVDLSCWLSLPFDRILTAANNGEIRSLGEGRQLTVMGLDVIEFVLTQRLEWEITAEGHAALSLDVPQSAGSYKAERRESKAPPAPDTPRTKQEFAMAATKSTRSAARSHQAAVPVQLIPLDQILFGPNPREIVDEDSVRSLAESIQQVGLIEPIVLRLLGVDYEIVCGERRYRACQLLGRETIEASVRELDDRQAAELRLLENLDREDLNPIEEAAALRQLRELGHSVASLAKIVRWAKDEVERREDLLKLPEFWQDLLRNGTLSAPAGEYLIPWLDHPDVLSAVERHAQNWPMPLTQWRRYIHEAVMLLSRNMDPEAPDGPLFDPTADELERLDCLTFLTSLTNKHRRAFNVQLWDRLQDQAEAEADSDPTDEPYTSANGKPARSIPEMAEGDAGPVHDAAFWQRVSEWKANWFRQLIAKRLADCDLDELTGFCELLNIDPEDEWVLSRGFLQLHDARQLTALAADLDIDVSDADGAEELKAILLHVQPVLVPPTVQHAEEHLAAAN